jgi:hypothetical protein
MEIFLCHISPGPTDNDRALEPSLGERDSRPKSPRIQAKPVGFIGGQIFGSDDQKSRTPDPIICVHLFGSVATFSVAALETKSDLGRRYTQMRTYKCRIFIASPSVATNSLPREGAKIPGTHPTIPGSDFRESVCCVSLTTLPDRPAPRR